MDRIEKLIKNYEEAIDKMIQFIKDILRDNGGVIELDVIEYRDYTYCDPICLEDETEYPVVITMWDHNGNNESVEIISVELEGDAIYAKDAFTQCLYEAYPEHVYWVIEFIKCCQEQRKRMKNNRRK